MSRFKLRTDEKGRALVDTLSRQRPLRIDFASGRLHYRRTGPGRKDRLAKATGARPGLHVIDCTAGLGRDSFLLASFGCRVTMVERSPVLVLLLEDALERARETNLSEIIGRITLVKANSIAFLEALTTPPDVIYIDAMFPPRTKHAKVKGDMQMLQRFLGIEDDTDALLEAALATGCPRVVLKQPARGGITFEAKPTATLAGKTSRFEIFSR